ncbi:MAG: Sec-independent protein translocase protein TatB [Novosphingobium sp.]
MFDIGASELLLTVIVAIVVIGPKDLPRALRMAGSWLAKVRRVSGHFRSGIEEMIRQAELDEMEKKWREKNAEIMKDTANQSHPDPAAPHFVAGEVYPSAEAYPDYPTAPVETAEPAPAVPPAESSDPVSPELPLAAPKAQP